ncbi:hypothetical protein [Propioniciclava flava]
MARQRGQPCGLRPRVEAMVGGQARDPLPQIGMRQRGRDIGEGAPRMQSGALQRLVGGRRGIERGFGAQGAQGLPGVVGGVHEGSPRVRDRFAVGVFVGVPALASVRGRGAVGDEFDAVEAQGARGGAARLLEQVPPRRGKVECGGQGAS